MAFQQQLNLFFFWNQYYFNNRFFTHSENEYKYELKLSNHIRIAYIRECAQSQGGVTFSQAVFFGLNLIFQILPRVYGL